ncbi:hypothetical protein [Sphaerisporangium corydalis]|uniref:Uncharacterized protein n=1 Tax=Sphaerisporangium corydalis TaxID=1441875 RepID=A0ABV9E8M6_9ACTN|nr:hypothetical protein [Sphaerisporangium corydalis]
MRRFATIGLTCGLVMIFTTTPIKVAMARTEVTAGTSQIDTQVSDERHSAGWVPTQKQLRAALLRTSDLPRGFREVAVDSGSIDGLEKGCPIMGEEPAGPVTGEAHRILADTRKTVVVSETLAQMSNATARKTFAQFSRIATQCRSFSFQSSVMGIVSVTITPIKMRKLGAGTAAMRIKADTDDIDPIYVNSVLVRHNGTLIFLEHVARQAVSRKITERYAALAYKKVRIRW